MRPQHGAIDSFVGGWQLYKAAPNKVVEGRRDQGLSVRHLLPAIDAAGARGSGVRWAKVGRCTKLEKTKTGECRRRKKVG
jgi:hypothetical protein